MEAEAKLILESASDSPLADTILRAFKDVERNYFLQSWKTSELDSGHFVELVRRFIDFRLFGSYTPIGKNLSKFNNAELSRLEGQSGAHDSYRFHIPRLMFAIYGMRNKRGIGHVGPVSANYLDATLILSAIKWILAEILRIESNLDISETVAIVDRIVERPVPGIWDAGSVKRILIDGLTKKEQVLFLLLAQSPQTEQQLIDSLEVPEKGRSDFRKVLRALHREHFIEYTPERKCILSPKGFPIAERIALNHANGA